MQIRASQRTLTNLDVENLEAVLALPGWRLIQEQLRLLHEDAKQTCRTANRPKDWRHAQSRCDAYEAVHRIPDQIRARAEKPDEPVEEKPKS